jgi:hypothetical protein
MSGYPASQAPRCPTLLRPPPAEDAAGLFSGRFLYRTFYSVTGHAPYLWNKRWVQPLLVEQTNKMGVASQSDPYTKVFRLGPLLGHAGAG